MGRKLEIYKIVKMGVKSNEESKNSTLLEQIFKEGLHDTPAHHAHCAGAVFWEHIKHASDFRFFGDKRASKMRACPAKAGQ